MSKKLLLRSLLLLVCFVLAWPVLESRAQGERDVISFAEHSGAQPAPVTAQAPACSTDSYTVSDTVPASFEDISGTGTPLGFSGWDDSTDITSPFSIPFYCGSYTTVRISSEGYINFGDGSGIDYTDTPIPTTEMGTLIAPMWHDLDPDQSPGDVYWQVKGSEPDRRLIVQWFQYEYFSGTPGNVTFQVIIYEGSGIIQFQYLDVSFGTGADSGAYATVGIQKDSTTGIQYSHNTPSLHDGLAITFTPQASPCTTAGYYYDDMVPYDFEDISGTGTDLGLSDEGESEINLPFTFNFYCTSYTSLTVGANGGLTFSVPAPHQFSRVTQSLPSDVNTPYQPYTMIVGLWDDLNPAAGGAVLYEIKGNAPDRRLIVQWDNVPRDGIAGDTTFQIIFYESNNKILMQYQDVDFGNATYDFGASATVGVQKDGLVATEYSFNSPSLSDGMAILFSPYTEIACPSNNSNGMDYDCHRNGVWLIDEVLGTIYMLDPDTLTVTKTINLAGKVIASNGGVVDVSVLDNGNLLLSDFQGDGTNIDDYILEFDPDSETLVNYWPLDGSFNTSTDGTSIDEVVGVEMVSEPFRRTYVTSRLDPDIYEIALVPGNPGTWSTIAVHAVPSMAGITWGVDKIACYEDTPMTGFAVTDRYSSVINFYNKDLTLNSSFDAQHGTSTLNTGVTVVPGNPAKLWVVDPVSDNIGIFDTQEKCTLHCGKFPWHEIIGALSQGASPPPPPPPADPVAYWGVDNDVCCQTSSATFTMTLGGISQQSTLPSCAGSSTWEGYAQTTPGPRLFCLNFHPPPVERYRVLTLIR